MPHKGQYELEKDPKQFTAKRKNENGLFMWAKVKNSNNSLYGPGCSLRVHMCFRDPCRADYADTKYGPCGPRFGSSQLFVQLFGALLPRSLSTAVAARC